MSPRFLSFISGVNKGNEEVGGFEISLRDLRYGKIPLRSSTSY